MKVSRPVLRYHGGKWLLAPWLLTLFPAHRLYVEPFGGGANVLLRKPRAHAEIYNDLNGEVVNVFRVMRDPEKAERLRQALVLTPFARKELRDAYRQSADEVESARRTLIRSFMGFGTAALQGPRGMRTRASIWPNTGFRADSDRSGTTPAHDWAHYPASIAAFTERLRGVVIEEKNALQVIKDHDRHDALIYADPPYLMSTRRTTRHEYTHEMTEAEHVELAEVLQRVRAHVIISGYASDLYDRELYRDWLRLERPHLAHGARPTVEVVWLNDAAAAHMPQPALYSAHAHAHAEVSA